jgi:hypothetical protein
MYIFEGKDINVGISKILILTYYPEQQMHNIYIYIYIYIYI